MIQKLGLPNMKELTEKLNEVIDVINSRASFEEITLSQQKELEQAAKLASHTGSQEDLHNYLKLRRKYL